MFDDKVYATYIDHMGDDARVEKSARVSFLDDPEDENRTPEQQAKLIRYLASHGHFTPFTHCTITLLERVPLFVARQRFKHTVGFSYNEVSRRYNKDDPEIYFPFEWRLAPDKHIKQGSSDQTIELDDYLESDLDSLYQFSLQIYKDMLSKGIAPEQARMVLPQSMYTSYYVTGSLAAWARTYKLRSSPDAQWDIRQLAEQWNKVIEPLFPISWKALTQ